MIKLNNLQKYFFKGKDNEIHVINDISLTLPDKGLVVLLGPSGSGKTTLLNVLGGLDKVRSGSISFDQETIERYDSRTWDRIRNKQVGYIFQNYNLLTNLTVYDNIALTLNMINIYDKEEIDKRIDYILDAMGMINYRKRRASQLSGGQQQRVAIARALAKNPKVIIADEPTGNLDSKNTQDIMNIIKKISQNKLVVLVTHEENIANFYGDRIIRLQDGKIVSDSENRSNGTLDVQHETDIYLGDMREVTKQDSNNTQFSVYSDESIEDDLDVRLIVKNKTIYVDVKSKEYRKMQLLENDSEIRIYEGQYEQLQKEDFTDTDFNLQSIITEKQDDQKERHSVITVKDSLRLAGNRLRGASRLGKLFYVGFAGVAILIAIAVGMLSGIFNMDPARFLQGSKQTVIFDKDEFDYEDIVRLGTNPNVEYIQFVDNFSLNVKLPPIYQSYNNDKTITRRVVYSDYLDESKLVMGRGVQAINEFVIDNEIADALITDQQFSYLGITTYESLMQLDYVVTLPGSDGDYEIICKLVGIVEDESTVMYAPKELVYMEVFDVGVYEYFEDDITLDRGFEISDDDEMLIYDLESIQTPIALNVTEISMKQFRAVGAFTSDENVPMYMVKTAHLEEAYFDNNYKQKNSDIKFYAKDTQALIDSLKLEQINAYSSFDEQLKEYSSDRLVESLGTIVFTSVVLGASAISYFFILRSSLLSRIYEVSVYRALGVTKGDIRKMFVTEIILITTLTSMIGYLVTSFIMYRIQILAEDFLDIIHISPLSILAGVVIIYATNIIAGLIPVSNLLRKTPAEILSKYDF